VFQCYAELARLGVVALGASGFSKDLADVLKPYFYASGESSTNMGSLSRSSIADSCEDRWATQVTEQLQDLERPRPGARGHRTDDPDNKDMVKELLGIRAARTRAE